MLELGVAHERQCTACSCRILLSLTLCVSTLCATDPGVVMADVGKGEGRGVDAVYTGFGGCQSFRHGEQVGGYGKDAVSGVTVQVAAAGTRSACGAS